MEPVDLAVDVRGSGRRTLVLLHGLGSCRDHFEEVASTLEGRCRLVLPDLRGHGGSPAARVERLEDYVADLVPIVRAHAPVALCGTSFGGDLALFVWNAAPDAVEGVCVVEPLLDMDALWRWAYRSAWTRRGAYRRLVSPFFERNLERLVALMAEYPLTADLDEPARRRNAEAHLRASEETLHSTLRVLRAPPSRLGRPSGTEARALVVRALRSPACPAPEAAQLAERLGGEVGTVDAGHCVQLAAPRAFADVLSGWLSP